MIRWLVAIALLAALGVTLVVLQQDASVDPDGAAPSTAPAPTSPTTTPPAPQPTRPGGTVNPCPHRDRRLTVLTLNIHAARTKAGRLDLDRVAHELAAWEPDVALLQEVDRGRRRSDDVFQARRFARLLGMSSAYGGNHHAGGGSSGNAVLSRFPIVVERNHALPTQPGLFPRGLLQATLDVEGQRVDVFSTHLDHVRPSARRAQSRAVARIVRRSHRPVLLGGDLNSEPGMPPVRTLARAGLFDTWPVAETAGGRGRGLTVPAARPRRRIDFVLAGPSFVPVRSEVLISSVSDHRAVRATLDLLPASCR